MQPIDRSRPSNIPAPNNGNVCEISLFPVKQLDSSITITSSGDATVRKFNSSHCNSSFATSSASSSASSSVLQSANDGNCNDVIVSRTVTHGIELTATALFVPHNCTRRYCIVAALLYLFIMTMACCVVLLLYIACMYL